MRSNLGLLLFGFLVLLALSAVMAEQEENNSMSEELAEARLVRSPHARKGKSKKGKRGKGKGNSKRRPQGTHEIKRKRTIKNEKKFLSRKGKAKPGKQGHRRMVGKWGNNKSGRKIMRQETEETVSQVCFDTAMSYMKIWKDTVANFERQRKRMVRHNTTGGNKSGNKGLFAPAAHRLVDIGGGNKSNMSCGGQYGNVGAAQLENLTETLFNCEMEVEAACHPANFPQPNLTFVEQCQDLVGEFKKNASVCLGLSLDPNKTDSSAACDCWSSPGLSLMAATVRTCKIKDHSGAITAALRNCTKAFQKCRKYEDAAHTALSSCVSDTTKMTKKAASLAANEAAMTAAKEKMNSLAGLTRQSGRQASSCLEIISFSQKIVQITKSYPQSTEITTYAKKISSSDVTCSADEKVKIQTEVVSLGTAIASVQTALETIQEQIMLLTGSTASSNQLNPETTTATVAPAGRRDRIRKQMLANF